MAILAAAALLLAAALGLSACGGGSDSTSGTTAGGSGAEGGGAAKNQNQAQQGGEASGKGGKNGNGGNGSANGQGGSGSGGNGSANGQGGSGSAGKGGSVAGNGESSGGGSHSGGERASGFKPRQHNDSGGGSGQFKTKGGDNAQQEFGKEAGPSEFDAATKVLHNYFDARAERRWNAACEYLAQSLRKSSVQSSNSKTLTVDCAETLIGIFGHDSDAELRELAKADVGSLRQEDGNALLFYHGAKGAAYVISMSKEGGAWKVAALTGSPVR